TGVTTRTIRRDLEALQASGFPLYDETIDGKRYWMLEAKAFRRLDDTAFTLAELSALYFSRTLLECLAATPFQQDVAAAFDKLSAALTPGMRQFLDRLPLVFQAQGATPRGPEGAKAERELISKLLDAPLNTRRATTESFSRSARRDNEVLLDGEGPGEGLRDGAVPPGLFPGRPLSRRVRAGVQGDPHLLR